MTRNAKLAVSMLGLLAGSGLSLAGSDAYTAQNSDEIRAIVSEMLSDAQNRSSLLAASGNAGHDEKGFYIADDSGNFRLNIGGVAQFRYYLNFRDTQDGGPNAQPNRGNDDFESGFQTRRTKLYMKGNVVSPNLTYNVQANFSRSSGDFFLEDAWAKYKCDNGLWVQWGQFKDPFLREELVSDWFQLTAERSMTNSVFTDDRVQGVMAGYDWEAVHLSLCFSDGANSKNSELGSVNGFGSYGFVNGGGESDWAFAGRVEFKVAGTWDQFKDFTSMPGSDYGCMIGVAGHVEGSANDVATTDANGNADQGDTTYGGYTLDLSVEGDGWNFYAAGVGSSSHSSLQNTGDISTDDYGLIVQGGFFIPNTDWELFARYDIVFQDASARGLDGDDDDFATITAGTNYYWAGHAAKFTFDVEYYINHSAGLIGSNTGIGYLSTQEDGEVCLRFQFQLLF